MVPTGPAVASLAHLVATSRLSLMGTELRKRLQLLKEAIPADSGSSPGIRRAIAYEAGRLPQVSALSLSIELGGVGVRTPEELGAAFSTVNRAHAQGLLVSAFPLQEPSSGACQTRVESAATGRYYARDFADEGRLIPRGELRHCSMNSRVTGQDLEGRQAGRFANRVAD